MAEYEIREPHPKSTIDELQRTWDDLLRIDRLDPTLLGEVFQSFSAQDPPPDMGACPHPEGTVEYADWCADRYAAMIGYKQTTGGFPPVETSEYSDVDDGIDWEAVEAPTPSSQRIMRPR